MRIHNRFVGGNIRVSAVIGNNVYLEQELRDTFTWWFYWAFCVEEAQGQTLTFHFCNSDVVGYWGPAVSHDNVNYAWAGKQDRIDGATFRYTFGADESRVFFCYALPYHYTNYENWLRKQTAPIQTDVFCVSERGRNVPCFTVGNQNAANTILFTSRHHACESMATWVLEAATDECIRLSDALKKMDCNLLVVPFVDFDGVQDGDQGKNRAPHDQNRDYIEDGAIFAVNRTLMQLPKKKNVIAFVDFHDPWYLGDVNDYLCLIRELKGVHHLTDDFAANLQVTTAKNAGSDDIVYRGEHDLFPGDVDWVAIKQNPVTSTAFWRRNNIRMAQSIEIPYFGTPDFEYNTKNVKTLGKNIADALLMTLGAEID